MRTTAETTTQHALAINHLTVLTHLEVQVRAAKTIQELQFISVNETRRLIAYEQATLLTCVDNTTVRVVAASSVPIVDRDAPMIRWLEQVTETIRKNRSRETSMIVSGATCPQPYREGWEEYIRGNVILCPLKHPDETELGFLWLERASPWNDNDVAILKHLTGSYAYAWKALTKPSRSWPPLKGKVNSWWVLAAIAGLLCLPVRISTIAPFKVIAKEPIIVSASMDGVISEVLVPPNTMVTPQQPLLRYEDINIRNEFQVAERRLAVAQAEHSQAVQAGFADPKHRAEMSLKEAEMFLRETELAYANDMLKKIVVRAPQSGLLIYADKADWVGKPVVVGQQIMQIADPQLIELRIHLPVNDALLLKKDAEVVAFFDALVLESFTAKVSRTSFHAEIIPGDVLAYRVTAELLSSDPRIQIGWQGSAKVYGERGPLAFMLFRRPLTALRQFVGV
ncbi:MAG: HlyD family efflux transporter periplasmic adaptor subunit [Nitrospira sp.]